MNQNLFEQFSEDPVEYNIKHLKTQLYIALITLIRGNNWTQAHAAKALNVSAPRMSNLFNGHLEKFSTEALIAMLVIAGCELSANFEPFNDQSPVTIRLYKP